MKDRTVQKGVTVAAELPGKVIEIAFEPGQEVGQVVDTCRDEKHVGRPADAPRRMAAHRLVLAELAPDFHISRDARHACTFNDGPAPRRAGRDWA